MIFNKYYQLEYKATETMMLLYQRISLFHKITIHLDHMIENWRAFHATDTFFRFIMAMFLNACIDIKIKLCVLEQ